MSFLNFTVETYERRIHSTEENATDCNEDDNPRENPMESGHYLSNHRKHATHIRVSRSNNHPFLPNIIGPWVPRRDAEGTGKCYYYASMIALLKPWRTLEQLKAVDETWEQSFETFVHDASQRDKDVLAGFQYYYESKNDGLKNETDDERNVDIETNDENEINNIDDSEVDSINISVSVNL